MVGIFQRLAGLGQNGLGGHQPHYGLGPALGHGVKNRPQRTGSNIGLAAAGGHLGTHMGHAGEYIHIIRHTAEAHQNILFVPEGLIRLCRAFLHAPLQPGNIPGDFLKCDVMLAQCFLRDGAQVGIDGVALGFSLDGSQKGIVQRGDAFPLIVEVIGGVAAQTHEVGLVRGLFGGQGLFGLHVVDVFPDFLRAHFFVEVAIRQQQHRPQLIVAEIAA